MVTGRFPAGVRRRRFLLGWGVSLVWAGSSARAQVEDLLEMGQRLLEEHVDPAVVKALRSGDLSQVDGLLQSFSRTLQGDTVLDLAELREAADLVLPLLERSPRTKAYAPWLKARLDYFQVADTLKARTPPVPSTPGRKAPPPPNPTPKQEREAWRKQVGQDAAPVSKGASFWVPRLKPVLRKAGAPPELVWLAEIESSFEPAARSPAGAVGMFQLTRATAQGLGLKVQPNDERLVPELSARAAGQYLRKLHGQFKEWRLALAAYNAGPGRISETLKKRRATSFDAIAPVLPAETQMYVPKFEAVLAKREKLSLADLKLPPSG